MNRLLFLSALSAHLICAGVSQADTFGSGANSFDIDFATIGNPGNVADTTGRPNPAGSVPYGYRIGKYEIPEDAIRKANAQSVLDGNALEITLDARGPNKPATGVSWFEAAKFVNWLNTSSGFTPAYKFDSAGNFDVWHPGDSGYTPNDLFRNSLARYFLPSMDEWYKAAYYDPLASHYWDYATGSDSAPTPVPFGTLDGTAVHQQGGPADVMLAGGKSPYGTVGQAGNALEWEETEFDLVNDSVGALRGTRGGDWFPSVSASNISCFFRGGNLPDRNPIDTGIRIVSVIPEPGAISLSLLGIILTLAQSNRRRYDA